MPTGTATPRLYTRSLHDALPISTCNCRRDVEVVEWLHVVGNRVYATFHNTSQTCSQLVGVASYQMIDNNIDNQVLYDFEQYTLAPGETRELSADLPSCAYQADAFCGQVIHS